MLTMSRLVFALLILVNFKVFVSSKSSDYEVELVQVLFRHGDRTPSDREMYPKSPYNRTAYEPFGLGQLTNKGKERVYHFGQVLKKRYADFLGDNYKPGIVYGYSTNVDRTKMSLQLVLAGMFPPNVGSKWNDTINWTPIPVHYTFDSFDFLNTVQRCPELEKFFNDTLAMPEVQRKLDTYKDFIKFVSDNTGLPNNPQIAVTMHENIHAHLNLGLNYPDWCNDEVYDKLRNVSAFRYDLYVYTDLMRKIVVGPTIRRFLRNIKNNDIEMNGPKIYLYGAHDDHVATFVRTHNIAHLRMVDYGSAIVFEKLKGSDNKTYVRLLYYPGEGEKFEVLKLNNCDKVFPLSKYLEIMDAVLPFGDGTQCLYEEAYQDVQNVISGLGPSRPANILQLQYKEL